MNVVAFPLAYRTGLITDVAFGFIAGRRSNAGVACLEHALNREAEALLAQGFEPDFVTGEMANFYQAICYAAAYAGHRIPTDIRITVRCLNIDVFQTAEDKTG